MNIKVLLLALVLLAGCSPKKSDSRFKVGMYVKHIQSDCVGVIDYIVNHSGTALIRDYICEVKAGEFKHLKKSTFETHVSNLKYAGNKTVEEYKTALMKFLIVEKLEEKKNGKN